MSGYAANEALRREIAAGESPFVAKPSTAERLTRGVAEALSD
jgi:hypothetical protein